MFEWTSFYTYKSFSTISWKILKKLVLHKWYGVYWKSVWRYAILPCYNEYQKDPLNPMDPYLTCSFIFSFLIPLPPAPHHGPPFRALSQAGRLSATRPRLGFRPPPNNSCPSRRLPPRLEPPHPGASALRSAYHVVDHKSVLLVSVCQDVMQVGRAKPACLSSMS
jgi:hypothetical protein